MGFRTAGFNADSGELVFQDGAFKRNEKSPLVVVPSASFSDRGLVLSVTGDSNLANHAYVALQELFTHFGFGLPEPILFTEETICIAELEFDWQALLNPELISMATKFAKEYPGTSQIKGIGIKITLGFTPDQRLEEFGVVLKDKQLVVEPRVGFPLSERIYFTVSPNGSDAHIALIKNLEAKIMRTTAKKVATHPRA